jgi:hypothetical protein
VNPPPEADKSPKRGFQHKTYAVIPYLFDSQKRISYVFFNSESLSIN